MIMNLLDRAAAKLTQDQFDAIIYVIGASVVLTLVILGVD